MATEGSVTVTKGEVHSFVIRCMEAVGLKEKYSTILADLVLSADYRGHASHGLNKLEQYMNEVKTGMTTTEEKEPTVVKESASTALVDGNNLIGPYSARFCMDLAIEKAKTSGIGIVSLRGANHFGTAGWYSLRAIEHGLIGMAFTNTSPMMVPTRAKKRLLGTNPLSLGAPAQNDDSFVLDMATTSIALGKCEVKERRGLPLPSGWAVDKDGHETHTYKTLAGLAPLGGSEESSGYKGYGLGMLVEVMCGILSGGDFGPHVRTWRTHEKPANLGTKSDTEDELQGQCFIAINPENFADGFTDRMQELIDACRNQEPADKEPVLVAGDPERIHQSLCDKIGGIPYHPNQINICIDLAKRYNVSPMKTH